MKEIVIISGKGGTGKTSLVASFAALAENAVLADCDVDAADLHLVLSPDVKRTSTFKSGHEAVIRQGDCIQCGACAVHCRFDAIKVHAYEAGEPVLPEASFSGSAASGSAASGSASPGSADSGSAFSIDPFACEGCGVCVRVCPVGAIDFPERECGEWFVSQTRFGPMVHARLGIAAENSGKLVTIVRKEAQKIAQEAGSDFILVDGPPGIGCPVIASIGGASFVVVVTEPTLSGEHDLRRVLSLASHFGIQTAICTNKWDLNPNMADRIEQMASSFGAQILGRIPYDRTVTAAQVNGQAVVEYSDGQAAQQIRKGWQTLCRMIG